MCYRHVVYVKRESVCERDCTQVQEGISWRHLVCGERDRKRGRERESERCIQVQGRYVLETSCVCEEGKREREMRSGAGKICVRYLFMECAVWRPLHVERSCALQRRILQQCIHVEKISKMQAGYV
jgi:hypothetical protein